MRMHYCTSLRVCPVCMNRLFPGAPLVYLNDDDISTYIINSSLAHLIGDVLCHVYRSLVKVLLHVVQRMVLVMGRDVTCPIHSGEVLRKRIKRDKKSFSIFPIFIANTLASLCIFGLKTYK